jgi:hypothetical protein
MSDGGTGLPDAERFGTLLSTLEGLLASLPELPSLEDIERFVEERGSAVSQLAALDPTALSPTERDALAGRLRAVMEADQVIAQALAARRDEIVAELARIGHARRVAASTRSGPGPVRQVA